MSGIDTLAVGATVAVANSTLKRSEGGALSIDTEQGSINWVDPELNDYDDLFVLTTPQWILAIGEHGHIVWSWAHGADRIRRLGPITRLDLDGYDPGGLYRVTYFPVDDSSCIIETEVGFCLLHRERGLRWEKVHDDLTCRITHVSDSLIRTQSQNGSDSYSTADGSYIG